MIFAETHVRFASPGFYEEDLRVDVQARRAAPLERQDRLPDGLRGRRAAGRRGLGHAGRLRLRAGPRGAVPGGDRRAPARRGRWVAAIGMSYGLTFDETPAEAVERVRREQLEAAAESLDDGDDPVEAIHDARKRIKKTRALLRLARPGLKRKAYRRRNRALRDAGRGDVRQPRRRRAGRDRRRAGRALRRAVPEDVLRGRHATARDRTPARCAERRTPPRTPTCSPALAQDSWPLAALDPDALAELARAHLRARPRRVRARRPQADDRPTCTSGASA